MNLNWKQTESREMPLEVDKTSSPKGIYLRKDIETETATDSMTGETYTKYVYQEAFLTTVEYDTYILVSSIELKHDDAVIDSYTLQLIEEGIL